MSDEHLPGCNCEECHEAAEEEEWFFAALDAPPKIHAPRTIARADSWRPIYWGRNGWTAKLCEAIPTTERELLEAGNPLGSFEMISYAEACR